MEHRRLTSRFAAAGLARIRLAEQRIRDAALRPALCPHGTATYAHAQPLAPG